MFGAHPVVPWEFSHLTLPTVSEGRAPTSTGCPEIGAIPVRSPSREMAAPGSDSKGILLPPSYVPVQDRYPRCA